MNKNLNNAMFELEKADALLASIEALYMDFDFLPEEDVYKRQVQYGSVMISAAVRISRMIPSINREYVPSDSCKIKEVSAGPGMTWLFPRSSDVGWEAGCRMK